jgi:protein-S-isoprenylcysteine O-methyltransferase Ste14
MASTERIERRVSSMSVRTPNPSASGAAMRPRIGLRAAVRLLMAIAILPLVLFVCAGRWDWWQGWVYVGLGLLFTAISRLLVALLNPSLIAERAHALEARDTKPWDKVLVPVVTLFGPLVVWVVAGLDARWGWSRPVSPVVLGVALGVLALAYGLSTWAMVVNRFFSATVRIQTDRGHSVITAGPYRYVRHPGYAGGIAANLAVPFVLGSLWALLPSLVIVGLTALRTALEDLTLQAELTGYKEYAEHTKYRLLPGVW